MILRVMNLRPEKGHKMKEFLLKSKRKIVAFLCFASLACMMITSAFADTVTPNVTAPTADDFTGLMNSIGGVFTTQIILAIMGAIVAFSAVYALIWWGSRKAVRGAMSGIKKGKIRI